MSLILSFSLVYFIYRIFTCKEGTIFAIKEYVALCYLKYNKRKSQPRLANYDLKHKSDIRKVNLLPPIEEQLLEYWKPNSENRESILCFGRNSDGEILFAKITIENKKAIVWIQLKTKNGRTYYLPKDKLWNVPKTDSSCFAAAGLRIRCLMPFRKWRISYNGILREETGNETKSVHFKFSFIWTASSVPFDSLDLPNDILISYLAGIKWNSFLPDKTLLPKVKDVFSQAGNMMGTVSVNGEEESEVYLWGGRLRSSGISEDEDTTEYLAYFWDGEFVYVIDQPQAEPNRNFKQGFIVYSSSNAATIQKIQFVENFNIKSPLQINLTAGKHSFKLKFGETLQSSKSNVGLGVQEEYCFSKIQMSDKNTGNALVIHSKSSVIKTPVLRENVSYDKNKFVVSIKDELCKNVDLTGGKGSSLAELTTIGLVNQSFEVPNGFVVTTFAYQTFSEIIGLQCILKNHELNETAWGNNNDDLKAVCKKVVRDISQIELPEAILKSVKENLNKHGDLKFAVRSSASGEDSEEMSAAGQMETFLGVQGLKEISKAIVKCWASQFSHTAIQYKRQNGQELNSPMAVVVQEMIPAEKAGVMFTCNPLTGNPQNITITANYGLGESVVSATADPDTINVTRDADENLNIDHIQVGGKTLKITMNGGGGTQEEEVSYDDKKKCCLTNDDALNLAKLGIMLENNFGCALDIEWAFKNGILYLLQARPITTFDRETDFEIIHDTDSIVRSEEEYYSKANVGEVLPGAMHELGVDLMFKMMDISVQDHWLKVAFAPVPYFQKSIIISSKHVLFNTETFYKFQDSPEKKNSFAKSNEIGMFGRLIDDKELIERNVNRSQYLPPLNGKKMAFEMIWSFFKVENRLQGFEKFIKNFKMDMDRSLRAKEFYAVLLQKMIEIAPHTTCHSECSMSSSIYNMMLLSTLASANKGIWNNVIFGDFAQLLASCKEIESADVPFALQKLAMSIKECIDPDEFKHMKTEDALEWLHTSDTLASAKFKEFLEKHGHRCVKEFSVGTKPWRVNQTPLVNSLQEMVRNVSKRDRSSSVINETIKCLRTPLTWKSKLLLNYIVPICKKAVGRRERSKSTFIKIIDHFRIEYNILADKLVQEGRLPIIDLLFHLTVHEIDQLLETRSPKLIQKAIRRMNLYPVADSYRFSEIHKGIPKPLNLQSSEEFKYKEGDILLKGTPVSQGVVKGPVRVANNLEEAAQIKPGEILIAYSTDIGWSPYFPILKGVVTELGGLISHGAVVAREYGLPCVVALHGATSMFKTGEIAILDGNKGTLQRTKE